MPPNVMSPTNKVRLCERSEPQSEPIVGQARHRSHSRYENIFLKFTGYRNGTPVIPVYDATLAVAKVPKQSMEALSRPMVSLCLWMQNVRLPEKM
jgi:hypothetical protein